MKSPSNRFFKRPAVLILGCILLLVLISFFAIRPFVSAKMESILTEQSQRRGVKLAWKTSSWDPWRGQHFTGVRVTGKEGKNPPIAEIANISLQPSLAMYFGSKRGSAQCTIDSSAMTLRDPEGAVRMDSVSANMSIRRGDIDIESLIIKRDGLTLDLTGKIDLPPALEKPRVFRPNLKVFRATFNVLDVKPGTGPFFAKGTFTTDMRKSPIAWSTELKGKGSGIEWKGVCFKNADAKGKLSSQGAEITYDLTTAHGSCNGKVTQSGDRKEPYLIIGEISDNSGKTDTYRAGFIKGTLTLDSLKGSADLWELSEDIPAFKAERPDNIHFTVFPEIEVKNLTRSTAEGAADMTIDSISIDSPGALELVIDKRTLKATGFSAKGSYDGVNWIIKNSRADLLGGSATLSGSYRDGVMRKSIITVEDVSVSGIRSVIGKKPGKTSGRITGDFKGTISPRNKDWEGGGFVRMTDAPVVEVPLLDQAYQLFTAFIPGLERDKQGQFEADYTARPGIVEVKRFEARGGKSMTVSAKGEIDLRKKRVQGRARGKLIGLPGVLTSPLSRLLEMEVTGPYDDLRVKPLGPARLASATVSGTVDDVVETMEEAGKITGTVLKEGLKMPFKWMEPDEDDSEE